MQSNWLKSVMNRVAPWLRVLFDGCALMFNSFPRLGDAFGADDLPISFILRRDSRRQASGNRQRRYQMPVAEHRADARSPLRANADRGDNDRVA